MTRGRLAWVLAATLMVVFVATAVIDPTPAYAATVLYAFGTAAYVAIGAFLVNRVPTNPIGALMLLTGTFGVASVTVATYAEVGSIQIPPWLGVELARTIGETRVIYPLLVALIGIPLVYPDGHLPSRRFRWVVLLTVAGMISAFIGPIFGIDVHLVILVSVPVAFGGAVSAIVLRFRRGDAVQRQQVKWLAAVVIVGAAALLAGLLLVDTFPDVGTVLIIIGIAAVLTMPFVIGIAILRYRLYEIDRIISRTLSYAVVTAILGAVFVVIILLLQSALSGITGNGGIPVAISTLAVFALFQPVLRRVRRTVDRRFDRARYDGERTAAEFAERLRWETDMERVTGDLRTTVASAVAPAGLVVWLRRPSRESTDATSPKRFPDVRHAT